MLHQAEPHGGDRVFLGLLVGLLLFGLAALISASGPVGFLRYHDTYYFIKRQLLFGLLPGIILFIFCARMSYDYWTKVVWLLYGLSLTLLSLVFIPGIGLSTGGHRSWIVIAGFSFQPAELAKLAFVLVLAFLLTDAKLRWDNWQTSFLPILLKIAPFLLLIVLQPDIGTLSVFGVVLLAMFFLAKTPTRYLVLLGAMAAAAFIILVMLAPYRFRRITTFLHPEIDPLGVGYQINQAFLAVGSGGWWGLGWGHSRQKFQYLPEVSADTIYAVIAEETGFVVSTAVVLLIVILIMRGFKIAAHAPDDFSYLLVSGIMVWLGWQSLLNIGATVGALPLTGVPLPFVSHGGSALMFALAATGMVLGVSKQKK